MTDQNTRQINSLFKQDNPLFKIGDVVQDTRNVDDPYALSMVVLDNIVRAYGLVDCVLLKGDKKIDMWEGCLILVQ